MSASAYPSTYQLYKHQPEMARHILFERSLPYMPILAAESTRLAIYPAILARHYQCFLQLPGGFQIRGHFHHVGNFEGSECKDLNNNPR
jgi:hypothetical protein